MRVAAELLPKAAYGALVGIVAGMGLLLLATQVPLFGELLRLRIVQSGSMSPAIPTGSLVVIRPSQSYEIGDVITFQTSGARVPTTHRIIADEIIAGRRFFITKGDANEDADTRRVSQSAVEGKVVLAVPYLGYILDFARTPLGFLAIIVVPALAIVLEEGRVLYEAWRARRESSRSRVGRGSESLVEPTVTRGESIPSHDV
ncbi:signal peptidase I [Candidatus Parcubacteria bacterium]|nr:MAG: signal peptidase I [Candidatus Parcubacteria bacterium]GIW69135.1 MAG: hypothetical protein KatS3mg100_629 [Candidatus Parcubacteria bacterium]